MAKVDLGRFGAVVQPGPGRKFVDLAVELEALGFSAIWLTGGPLERLDQIAEVVAATKQVPVASGIIAVDRFGADDVIDLYRGLAASHPGRFVVGLGGAHGPDPMGTLHAYLDRLDEAGIEASSRVMATLGPRMLDLARERAAGALPVLVTPEYTVQARARLGDDTTLAVEQLVAVETDPAQARAIGRGPLGFLGTLPSYQANFRRMGFTDDELAPASDRMVDALVPWGDAATVAARVTAQLDAGADHVAISLTMPPNTPPSLDAWQALAAQLIGG